MMTTETVMRSWFEEVWNQKRPEAVTRLFAPDGVAHGLPGGAMRGPDGFRRLYETFCGAFPNIRIEVLSTVTEGEMIAARVRVTGTHEGGSMGVAATGRQVDFEGMVFARIADGQFREVWNVFDFLGMYGQLGFMPTV